MKQSRNEMRKKRTLRMRIKIRGTATRPRLVVYRSNTALLVQLVDDSAHKTIAMLTAKAKTMAAAKELGAQIAKKAQEKKISTVVFDRSGYRYHGAIKALADAAREGGLAF
jgi:large subunit ribosomal protein L18